MAGTTMRFAAVFFVLFIHSTSRAAGAEDVGMGVNYGRIANDILDPKEAVELVKKLNFKMVKIFDANPDVLQAFEGSGVKVSVMLPNQQIPEIADSQSSADAWVNSNVAAYYPRTEISSVLIGNEILSDSSIRDSTWPKLVPAMERIQTALESVNLSGSIKVSTPVAADALSSSYPPSAGAFKSDVSTSVLQPLLKFLSRTGSFYCANLYPYFAWAGDSKDIPLDYALFGSSEVVLPDGEFGYTNLLDAMTDATLAAISKLGYGSVDLAICETGWPTSGGNGASVSNAARYNNGLIRKTLSSQGSPRRSGFVPTYIFALFNENLKPGASTERYFGLTYPNGDAVYLLEQLMSGSQTLGEVVNGSSDAGNSKQWCIASPEASPRALQAALDYACSGGADCAGIQPDQPCFFPDVLAAHASYAFSSYWSRMRSSQGTCDFSGVAIVSQSDPSYGSCTYPGVQQ